MVVKNIAYVEKKLKDKDYIKTINDKELSENSVKDYVRNIKTLSKNLEEDDIEKLLKDYKKVINHIEKNKKWVSANTKKIFYIAIRSILKYKIVEVSKRAEEEYEKNMMEHSNKASDIAKLNKKPTIVQDNNLKWSDVERSFRDLQNDDMKKGENYVSTEQALLSMFVLLKPRRLDDYIDCQVYGKQSNKENLKHKNYIVITSKQDRATLVINKYKTSKSLGTFETKLTEEHTKILKNYHKRFKTGNQLIRTQNGYKYKETSNLSKILSDIFLKYLGINGIGIHMLRRLYITALDFNNLSIKQREDIAFSMGQTFKENIQDVYNWVNENVEDEYSAQSNVTPDESKEVAQPEQPSINTPELIIKDFNDDTKKKIKEFIEYMNEIKNEKYSINLNIN